MDVLWYVTDALRENPVPRLKLSLLLIDGGADTPHARAGVSWDTRRRGGRAKRMERQHEDHRAAPVKPPSRTSGTSLYTWVCRLLIISDHPAGQSDLNPPVFAQARALVLQSDVSHRRVQKVIMESDESLGTVRGDAIGFSGTCWSFAAIVAVCLPHDARGRSERGGHWAGVGGGTD